MQANVLSKQFVFYGAVIVLWMTFYQAIGQGQLFNQAPQTRNQVWISSKTTYKHKTSRIRKKKYVQTAFSNEEYHRDQDNKKSSGSASAYKNFTTVKELKQQKMLPIKRKKRRRI